ncbi:MAG: dTDP-4-dehydrorhamnose reductase [Xanthobacteraceae bacterium]
MIAPSAMGNSILIAGRSGRIARDLIEAADGLGLEVTALGRPDLDLTDRDSVARVVEDLAPRAIVNAAGLVVVDEAERDPQHAFAINCDGPAHLAAAAARAGVPLLHLSSDYVFDGAKMAPYREDDALAPPNVYGRSKAAGEGAVLAAHPGAIVVRTSWVYGPYGVNFLTTMLRFAAAQDMVRVVADQYGTPTAGADLARTLLEMAVRVAAKPSDVSPGIYHVAGSGETTWFGLAEAIFAGWARRGHCVPKVQPIPLAEWPGLAARPRDTRLDCSKLERAFGIRLPAWQDSLDQCLDRLARDHHEIASQDEA